MTGSAGTTPYTPTRVILVLQIRQGGQVCAEAAVYDGMAIGRDRACDIYVDHPDIAPMHACTRQRPRDGAMVVHCVGEGTYLTLADACEVKWIVLMPGVAFRLGPVVFQCIQRELASGPASLPAEPLESPQVPPLRCSHCHKDISAIGPDGRFCPHCGVATRSAAPGVLSERAPEIDLPAPTDSPTTIAALRARLCAYYTALRDRAVSRAAGDARSEMLLAYGNALFRLGWRHELSRNYPEALRCYHKAEQLGNEWAKAHLATSVLPPPDRPAQRPNPPPSVEDGSR